MLKKNKDERRNNETTVTVTIWGIIDFLMQPTSERLQLEIITKWRLVNVHKTQQCYTANKHLSK